MRRDTLKEWHRLVATRDAAGIPGLLDEAVVFHSPVVHTPQVGRRITAVYLAAAFEVFVGDSFRYVRELADADGAVLEFTVDLDGTHVNGVDLIRWNAAGLITDFKVMLRPLQAVNLIHRTMGERLAARRGAPGP